MALVWHRAGSACTGRVLKVPARVEGVQRCSWRWRCNDSRTRMRYSSIAQLSALEIGLPHECGGSSAAVAPIGASTFAGKGRWLLARYRGLRREVRSMDDRLKFGQRFRVAFQHTATFNITSFSWEVVCAGAGHGPDTRYSGAHSGLLQSALWAFLLAVLLLYEHWIGSPFALQRALL